LDLTHLGEKIINERLPGIRELAKTFAHVDPIKEPIPVVPTCHYMMGGMPTNIHGQVLSQNAQGQDEIIRGLYAIGECASVSVHGANRLGSNSLLDLVVFGRAAGIHIAENLSHMDQQFVTDDHIEQSLSRLNRWNNAKTGENMFEIRASMKAIMQRDFGVFRKGEFMEDGFKKLKELQQRLQHAALPDHSDIFNTMRIEALELDNLMSVAVATAASALYRTETRGSHSREDFPDHDNVNWLKHTLYFEQDNRMSTRAVNMKPTKVEPFPVKERVY
jgi:succinate dehydrogenase / fumarate reductase flavoprotein subunit